MADADVASQSLLIDIEVTTETLNSFNVEQAAAENKDNLIKYGGIEVLARNLRVNLETGLTSEGVEKMREKYGTNKFPESPMESYLSLLIGALSDSTLLILLAAATVSLVIGVVTEGSNGWIEGTAIFIAVFLVSNITAANDYTKQLQFRALEATSAADERCSVFRDGVIDRINPCDLVVGDVIILQAGDQIPADSIIFDNNTVFATEASLTGEPEDMKKSKEGDCFLLSSCLLTDGEEVRALVIGVGIRSQWGKIKANLVTEDVNTPLQDKLEEMTKIIGYIGMVAAFSVFAAEVISIWTRNDGNDPVPGFLDAFIIAVTIVVVAIPEGLPLAVTISLAYSTKKMYKDQCFIRVLAACETMGNATNICSDKTGTLTENRMTVVEGLFADSIFNQQEFTTATQVLPEHAQNAIAEQCCLNRTAYLITANAQGEKLERPNVIGNKTEGALLMMVKSWGFDYEEVKKNLFDDAKDRVYAFNSTKKRSTTIVHRKDGSVRLYCKGASEIMLRDCSMYMDKRGRPNAMTPSKRAEFERHIMFMADQALRTLLLAHKDYSSESNLPSDWQDNPPDHANLCCDCIVGIIDPLRPDVKEAVATAQRAGVFVRMVTGDNIATACAIARQCGILTPDGLAIEGAQMRKMTPRELDAILPKLQVVARSSPDDKFLLVTRLNGHAIPRTQEEWEERFKHRSGVTWENDRDKLLPGYREEWEASRPEGGEVVGVTGDGTNDAPALKAADVGLSMGITGTKVAQGASDIVILDDRFSSIVRSISWGRAVYDNIRKFLQFQLTVNVVALALLFIGAVSGYPPPLTAVQMLWVNLVMDTMGALALGTEAPTPELLERRPYNRTASLVSWPMWRNILVMSTFQLTMLLVLLFNGASMFNIISGIACARYSVASTGDIWNAATLQKVNSTMNIAESNVLRCSSFSQYCDLKNQYCYIGNHETAAGASFTFEELPDYLSKCLTCTKKDYTHNTLMFNTFIFCQVFNEYTSRNILSDWNVLKGLINNHAFLMVSLFTVGTQIFLIEVGGEFIQTTPLSLNNWLITIGLGSLGLIVGVLMRFIPVKEDPNSFFYSSKIKDVASPKDCVASV